MKTYQKILSLVLCVVTLFTTGCWWMESDEENTKNPEEESIPEFILLSDLAQYQILRGEDADEATIEAASHLFSLMTNQGIEIAFETDYVKNTEEIPETAKEILVGKTNRGEQQNLRYSDYSVEYKNAPKADRFGA